MKYIKEYEKLNVNEPEVGDYVIGYSNLEFFTEVNDFTKNNIGKLIEILESKYDDIDDSYLIEYYHIPDELSFFKFAEYGDNILALNKEDIKYWSKNKKELKLILQSNKFNI